jgi:hypothetical protein
MEIFNSDGSSIGPLSTLVDERIAQHNFVEKVGAQVLEFPEAAMLWVGGTLMPAKIMVNLVIHSKRVFAGSFPIEHIKINNGKSGVVVRSVIRSEMIAIKPWETPQPNWRELKEDEDLVLEPVVRFWTTA